MLCNYIFKLHFCYYNLKNNLLDRKTFCSIKVTGIQTARIQFMVWRMMFYNYFLTSKSMSCKSATRVLRRPLLYSSWASCATASVCGSFSFVPYKISFMATRFFETSSVAWKIRGGRGRKEDKVVFRDRHVCSSL